MTSGGLGDRLVVAAVAAVGVLVPFVVLTVGVLARFAPLETVDLWVARTFHALVLPRPAVARLFEVLAVVTHPHAWRVVAAVIGVVLWTRGRRWLVAWLVVTMAVGGLLSPILKAAVSRPRPTFADPVTTAGGYSFPSGHALNSMLFAAGLIVLARTVTRRALRAGVWLVAASIVAITGLDRIVLGVHYLSDVLAGWVVALATVTATTVAFATWRRGDGLPPPATEQAIHPDDDPGGDPDDDPGGDPDDDPGCDPGGDGRPWEGDGPGSPTTSGRRGNAGGGAHPGRAGWPRVLVRLAVVAQRR